jgi:nucleoid DNA-binding protein
MAKSAKPATKSEILSGIAAKTQLSRKQVASVFEALTCQIKAAVGKKGVGVFALPGLLKILVIQKPATPKRKGINPFTKQEQIFAAKPARRVIKVRALKSLKDMAK